MSAESRIVPSRRPSAVRTAGFAALLVVVSWSLGTFAAWPWAASDPQASHLRVSLRHVTGFVGAATPRSAEEIAKLPAHMRPKDATLPSTGRRADATLTITVDGRIALSRTYRPTGLRHDGPVYAYEEIALAPGHHTVTVVLADAGNGGHAASLTRAIEFRAGRAPLIEHSGSSGWQAEPSG